MRKANLDELDQFTTLEGSKIRELAGPAWTEARHQSLAESSLPPGGETAEHYHPRAEELYCFVAGERELVLLCCCAPPYEDDDALTTGR